MAWHQDVTYWGLEPPRAITAWIAIDDADVENGCMSVIPGSHRLGVLEHGKSGRTGNLLSINQEVPEDLVDEVRAVSMPLRAGQMSLHDGMLLHGSHPNRSSRRRCGLAVRFTTPDVRQTCAEFSARLLPARPHAREGPLWALSSGRGALARLSRMTATRGGSPSGAVIARTPADAREPRPVPRPLRRGILGVLVGGALLGVGPGGGAPPGARPDPGALRSRRRGSEPVSCRLVTVPDRTQRTGLRVANPVPSCMPPRSALRRSPKLLAELDGFDLEPRLALRFTGIIDLGSVSARSVFLVRLGAGPPEITGVDRLVWDRPPSRSTRVPRAFSSRRRAMGLW